MCSNDGRKDKRGMRYYFILVSSLLLILSLIAFSDNLFTDIGQPSNKDPKFIIHGLLMLAWVITFVLQSYFILGNKYQAHMRCGKIGFLMAIGVFVSTVYVFIAVFKGWDAMAPWVKANRLLMLSFATFILLAYIFRRNRDRHKRFIFWAIILPIEPIMGRVSELFRVDHWELFYILTWHFFFASFFWYDWKTLNKIHPISWVALSWFYIAWMIAIFS